MQKVLREVSQGLLVHAIDLEVCCVTLTTALDSAGGDPRIDPLQLAKVGISLYLSALQWLSIEMSAVLTFRFLYL